MHEGLRIAQWLYNVLSTDGVLAGLVGTRIYEDTVPESSVFPCVVFAAASEVDVQTHNEVRIYVNTLYMVEAVTESESYMDIEAIADRIDTLLDRSNSSVLNPTIIANLQVLSSSRDMPTKRTEVTSEGQTFKRLGGRYRIRVQGV